MRKLLLIIFSIVCLGHSTRAQSKDWRSYLAEATEAEEEGHFLEAGQLYKKAWKIKPRRKAFLYDAGNAFFNARAYEEAAESFMPIHQKEKRFPLIGLKYARSLKQLGRYNEAIEAFRQFAESYKGPGKDLAQRIVDIDIEGCKMGTEKSAHPEFADISISRAPENWDSPFDDQSPLVLKDSTYFLVSKQDKSGQLFELHADNLDNGTPRPASPLPVTENRFIGSACISEDGKRIYFSKCTPYIDELGLAQEECSIFVIYSIGRKWTLPIRLDKKINAPESSSNHPFVVSMNDQEWLFFSSNRRGSLGGMDIWYSSRPLENDEFNFSQPKNCSRPLNTRGDEVTPYFRLSDSTLFFSSNAHPGYGGFDFFFSRKEKNNRWSEPENMGYPINSPANELYFRESEMSKGFFVSNRDKNNILPPKQDYDILFFSNKEE
jgi:hypothetical protein